jgi:hypothetical protein
LGAASTAHRSPPSHAAPVTSESWVLTVSPVVGSSTTNGGGFGRPQAKSNPAERMARSDAMEADTQEI